MLAPPAKPTARVTRMSITSLHGRCQPRRHNLTATRHRAHATAVELGFKNLKTFLERKTKFFY